MGNGGCFVCGQKNRVGLKLVFKTDSEKNSAECITAIPDSYCGWEGLVHGGVISAIVDDAMAHACKSIGLNCVTAELNLKYKKPVPVNTEIRVAARVTDQRVFMSYHVVYTEAVVEIAGKVVNRATAKMFVVKDLH